MIETAKTPSSELPAITHTSTHSIQINTKNRDRSGSDISNSIVSNDSSIFDTMPMSDTASLASSAPSDNEDHEIDHKYHPPRISSKTYMQQTTETIAEDPDEDSENGDQPADAVHPAVLVTKATNDTSRSTTPPTLRLNTNIDDERPVEMRHSKNKERLNVANGKNTDKSPSNSISSPASSSSAIPTSAKKEKSIFHFPKLHRSKSQATLPQDAKSHSIKDSIKNVFSSNSNHSTISTPRTPGSGSPHSIPSTPQIPPQTPSRQISSNNLKSIPPPGQPPRRVASVGPNMMLNKEGSAIAAPNAIPMQLDETVQPAVGVGHKAIQGRTSRSTSEPPEANGIVRAKTLKECGITSRGKQAGKGATSTVTRCSSNGKHVALKMFKKPTGKESDSDFKRRINIEFGIAHKLHHPNVIETMELVWDEGKHNWAETMEWCGGGDLFTIIKNGNMTAVERNCCFKQLIRGVAYMHSMGIAHRDIKPENLLLNEEGQLKITDFGVSDVVVQDGGAQRKCHGMCGSEPYMAPEVHTHKEYDGFPLDIWSCGIVYVCLAFGGMLWDKAIEGNAGYDKYLAAIRKFEAKKEARKTAAEAEEAARSEEAAKAEASKSTDSKDENQVHSPTGTDSEVVSLQSVNDDVISRNSSALSLRHPTPPHSPPNGFVTPGTPALSRENSMPGTPIERRPSNPPTPAPQRAKSYKAPPSVKPNGMIQSPLPIYKAPGAIKGEVHNPVPHYLPFDSFKPLQKRLVYRMLDPNPETRITAAEILKDPWFKEIQCCSFDPDELFRVRSAIFDASALASGGKKAMPVKHKHPNHLINSKSKK